MAKSPIGTVEWFRNRARGIIAHARAIDDFGSATRSFQKLIELGLGGDLEVHAALHTAGVIAYARPFSGPLEFPKRQISEGLGFKNEIHEQLLLLRHKLVAHSDAKFADGRLFLKSLGVNNASGSAKSPPLGAAVMGRSIHTVQDLELAKAYHLHTHAAFQAASASINEALRDYAVTAGEHPDSYAAHRAEKPDAKKIDAGRFSLTSEQPKVTVPDVPLKPDELLSRPELTAGADGYTYRLFGHRLDFVGPMSLSFNLPDGTDVELTLAPIGPPGVIKTD